MQRVSMRLIDNIAVKYGANTRLIELCHGDLASITPEQAVDLLVVSTFPNDYTPTQGSLIGALYRNGLSVADLAQHKFVDLRQAFSCWLSEDIGDLSHRFGFKRILCFEPLARGVPSEVVGEIFQSLMPFAHGDPPISTIAMPLVASGDQGVPVSEILVPLLEAATRWLALGLPIDKLKIVERSEAKVSDLSRRFAMFKETFERPLESSPVRFAYHIFISYSHQNSEAVNFLIAELKKQRPDLRIFLDRQDIDTGHSWQQKIFDAIDDCHIVIAVYSAPYLQSKVCKEEFNIALFRHRESEKGVLFPVYLTSAELPTYMKLVQFLDCRECDHAKLSDACRYIVTYLDEDI